MTNWRRLAGGLIAAAVGLSTNVTFADSKTQQDGFGTSLPDGFTQEFVVGQLAPDQDAAAATLVGVKPWPARPNTYVAIVCLADSPARAESKRRDGPVCEDSGRGPENIGAWLGVFEKTEGKAPTLVARTTGAIEEVTDWSHSNIDVPQSVCTDECKNPQELPDGWTRFDLAPYKIRQGDYAFGVRAFWSEGYAGGGASFEALYLFRIDGNKIRPVFAQPMSFSKSIAGDWHKDGTRDHEDTGANNSLVVLTSQTSGFHDLQLRERGGKWHQTFKWIPARRAYSIAP
ncbi:hypothetical protein [Burkholderia sp. Ac-20365]|uniref:hypothetical protein n=1 Tax=Burkholderia sp. Ac-20365 TaxID=2703897 RepID=UPI00197C4908|nr:hypothetical protein [Burkholderia sp. Ac-20365]